MPIDTLAPRSMRTPQLRGEHPGGDDAGRPAAGGCRRQAVGCPLAPSHESPWMTGAQSACPPRGH
eukprot:1725594-Alexandrium_andersonii.AAC.1